jgi:hypothetical protein
MRKGIQGLRKIVRCYFPAKLETGKTNWQRGGLLGVDEQAIGELGGKLRELCETCGGGLDAFLLPHEPLLAVAMDGNTEIASDEVRRAAKNPEARASDGHEQRRTAPFSHANVIRVHREGDNLKSAILQALENSDLLGR